MKLVSPTVSRLTVLLLVGTGLVLLVVTAFRAYLEPQVFLPALYAFTLC